jgi:hypothetical protein
VKKHVLWRSVVSLVLGFVTLVLIRFIMTFWPNGLTRDAFNSIVSFPGWMATTLFFPEGYPTYAAAVWDLIFTFSEILSFTIIWYAVLAWRNRKSQSAVV